MSITNPTLSITLSASVSSPLAAVGSAVPLSDQTRTTFPTGSTAGSSDGSFTLAGSVTSGTPVSINLLALTDVFGNAITAGHVVSLKITNTSASGGNLSHGGGTNPIYAAFPVALSPGSTIGFSDASASLMPVVGSSTQNLQLTASTGTVTYTVSGLVRSA
jgi:hypothetical protein